MKNWIKEYFVFSRTERSGIVILLALIIILAGYTCFLQNRAVQYEVMDFSAFNVQIEAFESCLAKAKKPLSVSNTLFTFNPNTLPVARLAELGLSANVVSNIIKYREKGGEFKSRSDLRMIYGMTDSVYHRLLPYISIPKTPSIVKKMNSGNREAVLSRSIIVELNTANAEALQKVNGIGAVFSKRIVAYRNLLGGYHHLGQLMEVYGMDQERFEQIAPQLKLSDTLLTTIDINNCQPKELMAHPYVDDWNLANAIVSYRKTHSGYSNVAELKNLHLVEQDWLERIKPYLTVK